LWQNIFFTSNAGYSENCLKLWHIFAPGINGKKKIVDTLPTIAAKFRRRINTIRVLSLKNSIYLSEQWGILLRYKPSFLGRQGSGKFGTE
jgi:hypothetical protein